MIEVKAGISGAGRTIYDDEIARAADIGNDRILLECSGRHVECHALTLIEAGMALSRQVGGRLSIMEAMRATLEDIESRIPVEAGE